MFVTFALAQPGGTATLPDASRASPQLPIITTLGKVHDYARLAAETEFRGQLEGVIYLASATRNFIVMADDTGVARLELKFTQTPLKAGDRVRIEGTIVAGKGRVTLLQDLIIDNDGRHAPWEFSRTVHLPTGLHPIRVLYFQYLGDPVLSLEFEGPGISRRRIPPEALFHWVTAADGSTNTVPRLQYACYEGTWVVLPQFDELKPVKEGTVPEIALGFQPRPEHFGATFAGLLRIEQEGDYTFHLRSDDGSRLFLDVPTRVEVLGQAPVPRPASMSVGQPLKADEDGMPAEVEGIVTFVGEDTSRLVLELSNDDASMEVSISGVSAAQTGPLLNARIRVRGVAGALMRLDGSRILGTLTAAGLESMNVLQSPSLEPTPRKGDARPLPTLTTALQVISLSAEEAARHYPVRITGVIITSPQVRIQDGTRSCFIRTGAQWPAFQPRVGDIYEVEGITAAGLFAPVIEFRNVRFIGMGQLPEPLHPSYERVMSLSDTTQWTEQEGVIQRVDPGGWDFLLTTLGGDLTLSIADAGDLTNRLDGAAVRVRGVITVGSDPQNRQRPARGAFMFVPSPIRVCIVKPAPSDPFSGSREAMGQLTRFDPLGELLQRVTVAGQLTCSRRDTVFLTDGTNGIAVKLRQTNAPGLAVGDLVEVAGYRDPAALTPALRDAFIRKVGHANLPTPALHALNDLAFAEMNSARIRMEARLLYVRTDGDERVFGLQAGSRSFEARQEIRGEPAPDLRVGSRVEVAGVCYGQVARGTEGLRLTSFDLLLNSPADIRLLEAPPRFTLKQAILLIGALIAVILLGVGWIYLLRRKVAERTWQLETVNKELEAFSYSVSHDLRAPLRNIDGFSLALLEDAESLSPENREALQRVRNATQRMENLIDGMLTLARVSRTEMHPAPVNLSHLVQQIAGDLKAGQPEREVRFEIEPNVVIRADEDLIRIVLENLVQNAWKYTSKHASARIEFGMSQKNGAQSCFIRDDGAGFDMAFAGNLFRPFKRLHSGAEFEGTGIGLETVRRIIERHGGRVWAEGEVEKGATFYFAVPDH